ncbi:hypothetical protein ACU4GR_11090 [Methylobacterium oryzae CBMB20]
MLRRWSARRTGRGEYGRCDPGQRYRCTLALLLGLAAGPALAQSTGYVTGFPGKDPAGDEEIGWGPAYRPETSFAQPGTPPTPARSPAAPIVPGPGTASTIGCEGDGLYRGR